MIFPHIWGNANMPCTLSSSVCDIYTRPLHTCMQCVRDDMHAYMSAWWYALIYEWMHIMPSLKSVSAYVRGPSIWSIKVQLGISRTNADFQWNPVYNTFHRFLIVETKRFVGSSANVMLMWQACGQNSSRAAENKRRALGNDFSEWICYMFLMSKCRGDWELGLCTFWVFAKRRPLHNGDFHTKTSFARRQNRNLALHSGSLFASTEVVHRPRSQSPLHFEIRNI